MCRWHYNWTGTVRVLHVHVVHEVNCLDSSNIHLWAGEAIVKTIIAFETIFPLCSKFQYLGGKTTNEKEKNLQIEL